MHIFSLVHTDFVLSVTDSEKNSIHFSQEFQVQAFLNVLLVILTLKNEAFLLGYKLKQNACPGMKLWPFGVCLHENESLSLIHI